MASTLNNSNNWVARRFGVQLGKGAYGFYVFVRADAGRIDVAQFVNSDIDLNPSNEIKWIDNDANDFNPDNYKWLWNAVMLEGSNDGLQMKMVRANGKIAVYGKNGANYEKLGEVAIPDNVENEIRFVAGGDTWEYSNITVTDDTVTGA